MVGYISRGNVDVDALSQRNISNGRPQDHSVSNEGPRFEVTRGNLEGIFAAYVSPNGRYMGSGSKKAVVAGTLTMFKRNFDWCIDINTLDGRMPNAHKWNYLRKPT